MNDIEWCNNECKEKGVKIFGYIVMESFCERVAIKIESGICEQKAREEAFCDYTFR